MSDQNIAVRLKFLIEELGISNSQFADECNISRPTLSQLVTGRNKKVSDVIISQIHTAYPNLSILWLLFGEGKMWNNDQDIIGISDRNTGNQDAADSSDKAGNSSCGSTVGDDNSNYEGYDSKNARHILEIPTSDKDYSEYSKENLLNTADLTTKHSINKEVNALLKNPEFLNDLAKMKEKSKKVVHVTIYYDDSTFETFYPGK